LIEHDIIDITLLFYINGSLYNYCTSSTVTVLTYCHPLEKVPESPTVPTLQKINYASQMTVGCDERAKTFVVLTETIERMLHLR
jgi:hypothetical protein